MKKAARSSSKSPRRRRKSGSRPARTSMRVVHPVCCGIDVHRSVIVCTVARSPEGDLVATYEQRSLAAKWSDLAGRGDWLAECGCVDVCMESTGKYWVPVSDVLEGTCRVVISNPKYTRTIRGKKSDSKDATWIADLSGLGMVTPSYIPAPDIRDAREISRYCYKLACMQASERNRYQNCLTVSNSTLAGVLSDAFGKTARDVMERVVAGGDPSGEEECRELARGRAKAKAAEIADAVAGCSPNETQRPRMRLSSGHVDEIGCDMSRSEDAKHLVSWAGPGPRSDPGAGKPESSHVMKAGTYLKPLLARCALTAATRCRKDDYFARKYRRIKARRGHKRAIVAVARMMLTCIYHMLSNGEMFNPTDRQAEEAKAEERRARMAAADEQEREAIELLASRGYDVSRLVTPA